MNNYKINIGYLYKDSFSEKDFLYAVLKSIKDDTSSPSYIFDEMILSNVERINVPLILCDGKSNIEYSRMVGYDRIVTTTKYKTTTYGNGYQNKTHSTHSRTVTDWKYDSGTISDTASTGTYSDNLKIYDEYITNHIMDKANTRQLSEDELKDYELTAEMIDYLEKDILKKVYENNITYPGNHIKDEKYTDTTTLYNISCTIVSLYSLKIKIRDQEIHFIASSNGEIEIKKFGDYPIDNYDDNLKFNMKIAKERKAATKQSRMSAKLAIFSSLSIFISLLIIGIIYNNIPLIIISIVVLFLGLIIGFKFINDTKKISKPFYKKIAEHNKKDYENKINQKEDSYKRYLEKLS